MSQQQKLLIAFYALIAVAALVTTWGQNVAYFSAPGDLLGPFGQFALETKANPATRSITVDLGFFFLAASAFMVIEARRLGVHRVWLYILAGFLIAISVAFPLFMIARELRVAKAGAGPASWKLTATDIFGLALVTAVLLGLAWFVLN